MSNHPILYQTDNATVTLIDIPASVAHAQGFRGRILSCEARSEPFASTEPKTKKARDNVLARAKQTSHDLEYAGLINAALEDIRSHHEGAWSSPRWCHLPGSVQETETTISEGEIGELFKEAAKIEGTASVHVTHEGSEETEIPDQWDGSYHNARNDSTNLSMSNLKADKHRSKSESSQTESFGFHIPPNSSFLLADCNAAHRFRNFVRWMSQEYDKPRVFDLILLDPPWENRSAKRRAAYETNSVFSLIEDMDLSSYLAPGGVVAVWVTNKSAHRELVLGAGGIFESLNVSLIEEWIWIKTTTKGEPVTQVDGLWRKPYEVLLLARAPESRLQTAQPAEKVVRRVLAGVPDFHSRKPCIKTLIEPFLPKEYQALEVFARYLVEGWTSWGNEVLKFNYHGFYETEASSEQPGV